VLYKYPEYPYQSAFSIPELRQKLIAHLLNHVPNRYSDLSTDSYAGKGVIELLGNIAVCG
jgi:hypothetical protein